MKKLYIALLAFCLCDSAFALDFINYFGDCVYIRYIHNGSTVYTKHVKYSSFCSAWEHPECMGHFQVQVLNHTHNPYSVSNEVLCTWEGDITGNGQDLHISPDRQDESKCEIFLHHNAPPHLPG